MSDPSKAWAMLTARGAGMGGVHGGIPSLTAADVARMLRGLDRGPFLAGMVRESGDISCLGPLERWLWVKTMWRSEQLGWPNAHGQAYCRRLAGLAVLEFVMPRPEVCPECHGRGWITHESQGIECRACANTGGQKIEPRMRAQLAGIPPTSWTEGWAARYEDVHATVQSWHSDAKTHLRRALEGVYEDTVNHWDLQQPVKMA